MYVCVEVWLSYSVGYAAQTLGAGPLRRLQVQRWRTPLMSVRAWLCKSLLLVARVHGTGPPSTL